MTSFPRTQTRIRIKALETALHSAAEKPSDADAIHDLRVASRRFQQCLRTFALILDADSAAKIGKSAHKILQRCGAVRNCDITLKLLDDAGISAESGVVSKVKQRRGKAERLLEKYLHRWKHRDISKTWPERLFLPNVPADFDPALPALADDFIAKGRAAAEPGSKYHTMHQFRLACKRFRYSLELLEPLLNKRPTDHMLGQLRELQDILGSVNDCVSALELIAGRHKATRAITEILRQREQLFRSHWHKTFGTEEQIQWISTFSATAKRNRAAKVSRKPTASLPAKASKMSAA